MKTQLHRTALTTLIAITLASTFAPSAAWAFKGAATPSNPTYRSQHSQTPGNPGSSYRSQQPSFQQPQAPTPTPDASRPTALVGDWVGKTNARSGPMQIAMRLEANGNFIVRFTSGDGSEGRFDGQWYVSNNQLVLDDGKGDSMVMPFQPTSNNGLRVKFVADGPVVEMQRFNAQSQPQRPTPPQGQPQPSRPQPNQPQPGYNPSYNPGYGTPGGMSAQPPQVNAQSVVGRWNGQAAVQQGRLHTQCTFGHDGSFRIDVAVEAGPQGQANVQYNGTWRLEGNRVIVTCNNETDELILQNGVMLLRIENLGITINLHRS